MLSILLIATFSRAKAAACTSMSTAMIRLGLKRSFMMRETTPLPQPASITMSVDLHFAKLARAIASEVKRYPSSDCLIFTPEAVRKSRSFMSINNLSIKSLQVLPYFYFVKDAMEFLFDISISSV